MLIFRRSLNVFIALLLTGGLCRGQNLITNWRQVQPGIWSVIIGQPDSIDFLKASGAKPRTDVLQSMPGTVFPFDRSQVIAETRDGRTYLKFPLERGEKLFGLGLNFKRTQIRGNVYRLHVEHYNGIDDGTTHAPIPFYVSSKGYGIFINAARYIDVWAGTSVRRDSKTQPEAIDMNTNKKNWITVPDGENVEIMVPAQGVEVYVVGGPTIMDAVSRYNLLQGGGCLPPKWGLGFWDRTPSLYTQDQVAAEVAEFKKRDFPVSVIGLEPGWQSRAYPCTYAWDSIRFPRPEKFMQAMASSNIKVNLWLHAWVSPLSPIYKKLEPLSGDHTVWAGLAPDFTLKKTTGVISDYFRKTHLDIGVSGYKMDENDGNVNEGWYYPDMTYFPSGTTGDQMHQMYGMLMQKFTSAMFRERNQRTYGLVRASNAGAASFPYVLYDDYYSHPDFITALINSSFSGILWTPEARTSKDAEDWVRRIQSVCFSPLAMLNAWSSGAKPWSFSEVNKEVADVIKLRMQMLPYFYTTFADYAFKGVPPVRSLNLLPEFSAKQVVDNKKDSLYNVYVSKDIKNEFMFGDNLLVVPIFAGEHTREVVFPKGNWYDFYTGEYVGNGEVITISPSLDKIPLYVRDGGVIPMIPVRNQVTDEKLPLEIRYYGHAASQFELYDDDGKTFDYEKGQYTCISLVTQRSGARSVHKTLLPKGRPVWSYSSFQWHEMTRKE